VAVCVFSGYFFGNQPIVKNNFSLVILAIIAISVLPAAFEYSGTLRSAALALCLARTALRHLGGQPG